MIKAGILMLICACLINSKAKFKKQAPLQCKDILCKFDKCWTLGNCISYFVTGQYNYYGCAICQDDYELQEDANNSGNCAINSNAVSNCIHNAKHSSGTSICYLCYDGFILSSDYTTCTKEPDGCHTIDNCQTYQYDPNGKIICNDCKTGYTLNKDSTQCLQGCNVENCHHCVIDKNNNPACYFCDPNTIGVYNSETTYYDKCLSCEAYQCSLLNDEAKNCCLNLLSK